MDSSCLGYNSDRIKTNISTDFGQLSLIIKRLKMDENGEQVQLEMILEYDEESSGSSDSSNDSEDAGELGEFDSEVEIDGEEGDAVMAVDGIGPYANEPLPREREDGHENHGDARIVDPTTYKPKYLSNLK